MIVGADWCSPKEFWELRPGEVFMLLKSKTQEVQHPTDRWGELYDLLKGENDG